MGRSVGACMRACLGSRPSRESNQPTCQPTGQSAPPSLTHPPATPHVREPSRQCISSFRNPINEFFFPTMGDLPVIYCRGMLGLGVGWPCPSRVQPKQSVVSSAHRPSLRCLSALPLPFHFDTYLLVHDNSLLSHHTLPLLLLLPLQNKRAHAPAPPHTSQPPHHHDMSTPANETLYLQNLDEKIKKHGMLWLLWLLWLCWTMRNSLPYLLTTANITDIPLGYPPCPTSTHTHRAEGAAVLAVRSVRPGIGRGLLEDAQDARPSPRRLPGHPLRHHRHARTPGLPRQRQGHGR